MLLKKIHSPRKLFKDFSRKDKSNLVLSFNFKILIFLQSHVVYILSVTLTGVLITCSIQYKQDLLQQVFRPVEQISLVHQIYGFEWSF